MAFDHRALIEEIQEQYREADGHRPWIVGFSGGKDSTLLLQLVWLAVKELPIRDRQIYVVCNNTLVENPKVIDYVDGVLNKIKEEAHKQSMPVIVKQTTPALEDTFWVNLIGKGYPSPNNIFRWCTERLKINPTTKFILEKISDSGEVIILLGTRSDESANRAKNLKKREVKGSRLRKHILPNAYVYAAIKDVKTDDLWQYLAQVPSPWNASNKELITLYKNANSGDCPLVIDKTTPSCGNSRFGCWVCTVVKRDKSMEALVENGEDWMEPLMELRDVLATSRDDESVRETRGRDGVEREGRLGPYKPEFRAQFLKLLLEAQREIQIDQPEINLINYQELVAIQVLWHRDNIFNYNVAEVYSRVFGTTIDLKGTNDRVIKEKEMLKDACGDDEDFQLINELLALQKSKTILMNNRGLQNDLENHLGRFVQNKKTDLL
ncbi:DNA phosphorothioation system sulfurtransferase DndC [Roseivirga pacifica]|jgi:DNA sulfur modification protein DndC